MKPGTQVRMSMRHKRQLRAGESAEHVDEFGDCIGIVEDLMFPGTGVPEVNVRWQPSGLRYGYHPNDLVVVESASECNDRRTGLSKNLSDRGFSGEDIEEILNIVVAHTPLPDPQSNSIKETIQKALESMKHGLKSISSPNVHTQIAFEIAVEYLNDILKTIGKDPLVRHHADVDCQVPGCALCDYAETEKTKER